MDRVLHILILDDSPEDAELELGELRKGEMAFSSEIVDTNHAFRKALDEFNPDIILADYDLPTFNGLEALDIVKEARPDVPVLLVTGRAGEEFAIESLKKGATDYVMKNNLKRLASSVKRALAESAHKRELAHAQRVVAESEERFRILLDKSFDGIFVHADFKFLDLNQAMVEMTGYSQSELFAMKAIDLFPPESQETIRNYISSGVSGSYEVEIVRKDGSIRQVEAYGAPCQFHGIPSRIVGMRDITERKRAEEAIRSSEAQLSNALRIAHAGHWEYDVASDSFTFNDNFYKIFRTSVEDVGGYRMSSADYAQRFCHPEDRHLVRKETEAAIETRDADYSRELEHRILYSNGEVGYIAVRFFIVKDPQGRTVRTYGVNQDITDRKRLEQSLKEKMKALESWNKKFMGREQRMIELKQEVNALLERLGEPKKYMW